MATVPNAAQPLIGDTFEQKLAVQQQQDDAHLRQKEIRAGIWKVVFGTAIVGLAAAAFPAVQEGAGYYFNYLTEKQRIALDDERAEQISKNENRVFLESLSAEGRSGELEKRITLAEFYVFLSEDGEEKKRWAEFYNHLLELRAEQRDAVVAAARISADESANPQDVAAAEANARLLTESAESGAVVKPVPATPTGSDGLTGQLSSDDAVVRRKARTELSRLGPELVPIAMHVMQTPGGVSYRTELGLVVALTEMMRQNKSRRAEIIALLEQEHLAHIMRVAAHGDRTIRVYAGEFAYDLGDPRLFDLAADLWEENPSDNGRYNLALALKGAAPHVSRARAADADATLRSFLDIVGPKTDNLLNDALNLLPN